MMRRVLTTGLRASYTSSARALAEPAAATSSAQLVINFCTPHAPVHNKKVVDQVILPGAAGAFGITHGHSPIISQLEPGVVTVIHVGVSHIFILCCGTFRATRLQPALRTDFGNSLRVAICGNSHIYNSQY
jgi:hypothetical protein